MSRLQKAALNVFSLASGFFVLISHQPKPFTFDPPNPSQFPGDELKVSSVYFYKKSNIYGVKVNGKEAFTALDSVSNVLSSRFNFSNSEKSYLFIILGEVGGKFFDAAKSKGIAARILIESEI